MSENSRKSRKTKSSCEKNSNLIVNFLDKEEDDEPVVKKSKKSTKEKKDLDDSLKLFKAIKIPKVPKELPEVKNLVTDFLNNPSTSQTTQKVSKKPKLKNLTKKSTTKSGDIRKILNKQETAFHRIIDEECREQGLDPEEVQIALAISESLKDQKNENEKLPIHNFKTLTAKLEQFGFKSQRKYSQFELELLGNKKFSKKSKFTKFPTILTKTTWKQQQKIANAKFHKILEKSLMKSRRSLDEEDFVENFAISSSYLSEIRSENSTVFEMNNDNRPVDEILMNFYVTELFVPSFVSTDHLLRNWSEIPGREKSPVKVRKIEEVEESFEVDETSCMDIFADGDEEEEVVMSDESVHTIQTQNECENVELLETQLDLLHQTISQQKTDENVVDVEILSSDSNDTILMTTHNQTPENANFVDLTQIELQTSTRNSKNSSTKEVSAVISLNCSDDDESMENLENFILNEAEEYKEKEIDLTQSDDEILIPIDDSLHTFKRNFKDLMGRSGIEEDENSSRTSEDDDDDVIFISDEEINYSIKQHREMKADLSFEDEDENLALNETLTDVIDDGNCDINETISNLLEMSTATKIPSSNEEFSDSIREIMAKYGSSSNNNLDTSSTRSLIRHQSEMALSVRKSVHFEDENLKENLSNNLNFNQSFHGSLEDLRQTETRKVKEKKKTTEILDDKEYLIDVKKSVQDPDFENMTPVELKQALFKFGIRALSTKKAITILEYIYDRIHPKITQANQEMNDIHDSRRAFNITDVLPDINCQDDDTFPFQPAILDGEELVLPTAGRKKIPTCLIPLHISFYNMVRSNEKLQRYILEFRPVELDQIYKHFRKFGLTYDLNEIMTFLDRRCITFKTKEKSLSKTHEKKAKNKRK